MSFKPPQAKAGRTTLQIDWSNALAYGLKYAITFDSGVPYDAVRGIVGTLSGNAIIAPTELGPALQTALDSEDHAAFPKNDDYITGWSEYTVFCLAKNRKGQISGTGTEYVMTHDGGGVDSMEIAWIFSENTSISLATGVSFYLDEIIDGLHDTLGTEPRVFNAIGGIWKNDVLTHRINKNAAGPGTATSGTQTVGVSGDNYLRVGGSVGTSTAWDGWVKLVLIYDRGLSKSEWDALVDDPWQIFKQKRRFALADVPEDVRFAEARRPWTRQPPVRTPLKIAETNRLTVAMDGSGRPTIRQTGVAADTQVGDAGSLLPLWVGQIYRGWQYRSTSSHGEYGHVFANSDAEVANLGTNDFTILCVFEYDGTLANLNVFAAKFDTDSGANKSWRIFVNNFNTTDQAVIFGWGDGTTSRKIESAGGYATAGRLIKVVATRYAGDMYLHVNGVLVDSFSGASTHDLSNTMRLSLGGTDHSPSGQLRWTADGSLYLLDIVKGRGVSPIEGASLSANPWQIFKPRTIRIGKPKDRRVVVF